VSDNEDPNDKLDKLVDEIPDTLPLARAEWRTVPILVAAMSFATLVFSMVVVVYAAWEAREARMRVQRATECLIEQFAEHREANRSAHQAFAHKLDAPYALEPGGAPNGIPVDLEAACRDFIRKEAP
jgi:hypothetical protein